MPFKTCSKCLLPKPTDSFNKAKTGLYGVRGDCKSCQKTINQLWLNENHEKALLATKKWKLDNKIQVAESAQSYYQKNIGYYKNYRAEHKTQHNDYIRNRLATDIVFKLSLNIRNLVRLSMKRKGFSKTSKTADILGCSFEFFKHHLESQFQPWMNWENQGLYNGELNFGWDIDHITPLSSAKTEAELFILNNYTNIRPLCSYENRVIKGAKILID